MTSNIRLLQTKILAIPRLAHPIQLLLHSFALLWLIPMALGVLAPKVQANHILAITNCNCTTLTLQLSRFPPSTLIVRFDGVSVEGIYDYAAQTIVVTRPSGLVGGSYQIDISNSFITLDSGIFAVCECSPCACPAGPPGPVGPLGITGAVGPPGVQGNKGDRGAIGPMGPAGPRGNTGATGLMGPKGPAGTNGTAGAIGPIGPAGARGLAGVIGPTGLAGAPGVAGAIGPVGPAGAPGVAGAIGPIGPAGAQGIAGAVGPIGLAGAPGVAGAIGPVGPTGATGGTGPAGTDGTAGPAGATGATGPAGAGSSQYGYIYNLDNQVVPLESSVNFSDNGVHTSGITHPLGSPTIIVVSAGHYMVTFSVSGTEPSQFALFLNGVPVAGTVYGSGAGTQQNTGHAILAIGANDALTLRIHTSAAAVSLAASTPIGGTASAVNASVLIQKLN